jgi:hypothetical protein
MMTIGILVVALAGMSLVACQPVRQQAESAEPRGVEGKVFTPSIEPWGGVAVSMGWT